MMSTRSHTNTARVVGTLGPRLLPPVKLWFIASTLLLALVLMLLPLTWKPWLPDWLALVLVFWNVHQPRRVGIGVGFVAGVLLDVHQGAVLGQHALAYSVMSAVALLLHRRVLWFRLWAQASHLLPVFLLGQLVNWLVASVTGSVQLSWSYWLPPLLQMLLWPLASVLLRAPQLRATDRDENRPIAL